MSKISRRKFIYAGAGAAAAAIAGGVYHVSMKVTPTVTPTASPTPQIPAPTTPSPTLTSPPSTAEKPKLREGRPLLGNYDHWHYEIKSYEIASLDKWNILTQNFETAYYASGALKEIRKLNPDIKILVWISLGFWKPPKGWGGVLEERFLGASTEDWWIHSKRTLC